MSSEEEWLLDVTLPMFVANEVDVSPVRAERVCQLFKDGSEVAYVARYRADVHGGMSCEQVRKAYETFVEAKELNKKVEKAVTNLKTKIKTEVEYDMAVDRLKQSQDTHDVKEVMQVYASGRKTKADKARELGMSESAERILSGERVNMPRLVNKTNKELSTEKKVAEHLGNYMADYLNRLSTTLDVVRDIMKTPGVRITVVADLTAKAKKWTTADKEYSQLKHFSNYTTFRRSVHAAENYQILALERAEEKDVLVWKAEVEGADRHHPGHRIRVASEHSQLFHEALKDSITRLFIPKIQRNIKRQLVQRAEQGAINCFATNLGQLFAQEGIRDSHVVALDPGFSACKAAFLTPNGGVLETKELHLNGRRFNESSKNCLIQWAKKCSDRLVIAIGNGKASLETQYAVSEMIKGSAFRPVDVRFCIVRESGASKYSITPLAEEELPGMPVTIRSAVSIGRRLIDPMAEYVKIEPKHLGMGMYQHSVNEKRLNEALELVVRERVSLRGVDLNSASLQLLQQVCGLNKRSAQGIISLREKLGGRIESREQLKSVKGLGPKAFEQSAGFLTVDAKSDICEKKPKTEDVGMDGPPRKKARKEINKKKQSIEGEIEPLDTTIVHPMHYHIAKRLLQKAAVSVSDLSDSSARRKLEALQGLNDEESMVLGLLCAQPATIPPPKLLIEVRNVASLRVGEQILGRVENQTDFGLFIDIGAEKNALAPRSMLRQPVPEVGSMLMFRVESVEVARMRISVRPLE